MHNLRRAFVAVALTLVIAPLIANAALFDPDEGLHAAIAQEMVQRGDYVTPTFLGEPFLDKPILFFWAETISLRLFGNTEFAVRVPPLVFGLAGMLTVALLGRALFGATAGLLSGLAYGTMLVPFGVSQVAVHDIGLVPFMCIACWALVASNRRKLAVILLVLLAGVALGLSILTKGLVGCVFVAMFATCLAVRTPSSIPRLAIVLIGAGVVAALVAAPWYVAMERAHPGYLHYYFVERHLQGYLTATQRHAGRPFWYYLPIVAGGTLPWTAYLFLSARNAREDSLRLVVWGWFALGLVFLSIGESKLVTYALPLFPALGILAGDAIARSSTTREPGRAFRAAFIVQVIFLAAAPAIALIVLRVTFGDGQVMLWPVVPIVALATVLFARRAARSAGPVHAMSWMSVAAIVSIAGVLFVLPRGARWMTARDLAHVLNKGGHLPSRVSVLDERIGSLVFYLSPALRAQAGGDRISEASFADAALRAEVDKDDAILAVRNNQLPHFYRLFARPPAPSARAGTFTLFRIASLRAAGMH